MHDNCNSSDAHSLPVTRSMTGVRCWPHPRPFSPHSWALLRLNSRVENSMTEQVALDKAWAEPTGTTSTFTSAVATREERSGNC